MTRETKIGLLVAGSFLCLVAVVVASKWRGGDGGDAEEQTVVPGGVLRPTQNSPDAKPKGEAPPPKPAPVAAAQPKGKEAKKELTQDDGKQKGLPGLYIAPAVTQTEEAAIEKDLERNRLAALAKKIEDDKAKPVGVGSLPALPTQGSPGELPALPIGEVAALPSLPKAEVGALPPLPNADVGKSPQEQTLIPPPTPVDSKPPTKRTKDGEKKPGAGGIGTVEMQPVKPFDDKTPPMPDLPKPSPFDPVGGVIPAKQIDPVPAPKGPTFGQLEPLPEPAKPVIPFNDPKPPPPLAPAAIKEPGPIAVIPPTGGTLLPAPPIIVGGGSRQVPAVKDVNIDSYECQKGDNTFDILSLRMYGTEKYADALLKYNRDHSGMVKNGSTLNVNPPILNPGQQVLKPPQTILDSDYRASGPNRDAASEDGGADALDADARPDRQGIQSAAPGPRRHLHRAEPGR